MGLLRAGQELGHTEGSGSAAGLARAVPASRGCLARVQLQPEGDGAVTADALATVGPRAHVAKLNERKEKADGAEVGRTKRLQQMKNNHGLI